MPTIQLPTLHTGQARIYSDRGRLNAVNCGRRWGKTKMMVTMGGSSCAKGRKVGLFTPEHKQLFEPYGELLSILYPIRSQASRNEGIIRTTTGGLIDFWPLNDNDLAGRGREYDLIIVDEGAYTKNSQMRMTWEKSIRPTMVTRPGSSAWVFSTPAGNDTENFFWQICHDETLGFKQHYAPTSDSPYVPPEELERERQNNHPLVFQQEFLAKFISWAGVAFFSDESMLVNGQPVDYPKVCDQVFAVIDTAVKSGTTHDATAVSYWARSAHTGHPLVCLDWELVSVDGAMLEHWIPNVFRRLEELAKECRARMGSGGAWIEDAQSGSILLQQCANRGLPAQALPAKLTSAGKDGRALNVSGVVYQGMVKFSRYAFEKTVAFKGQTRNHLWSQIVGFRIGDKAAASRSDDGLDTFCYACAIALGNQEGVG
jgi:hypothetical protein